MIKTLIISGGAYNGLIELGILHQLQIKDIYNINNIENIYGTSVGGLIAIIISLNLNLQDVCEYFINRPWQKLLSINPLDTYYKKGAFDSSFFENMLSNLFNVKDLNIKTLTLNELFIFNKINIFIYTVCLSSFKLVELSHLSHPNLRVVDAISMSCSLPVAFRPVLYNNDYYLDGGIISNYPLRECLKKEDIRDLNELLGITFDLCNNTVSLDEYATLSEYIYCLFNKISTMCEYNTTELGTIPNEIVIKCSSININDCYEVLFNREKRNELVELGYTIANEWSIKEHYVKTV